MIKINTKKSKIRLLHQYYSYTGFYSFVKESMKKAITPIILLIVAIVLIDRYLIDFSALFTLITNTYSPIKIFALFFASESFLGLIPPEIFIAWADKSATPILSLSLLALLSYFGGIVSYFIGVSISKTKTVKEYLEVKMKKHLKNIKKWGGFLIVVGALLPIPFSMTSIAAGIINYKFSNYLLFGLLRFARFYLYAIVIFHVV
jgi:membrane protein YqaA with SNARE-associated domain